MKVVVMGGWVMLVPVMVKEHASAGGWESWTMPNAGSMHNKQQRLPVPSEGEC